MCAVVRLGLDDVALPSALSDATTAAGGSVTVPLEGAGCRTAVAGSI
jgi:hypothetical protein